MTAQGAGTQVQDTGDGLQAAKAEVARLALEDVANEVIDELRACGEC